MNTEIYTYFTRGTGLTSLVYSAEEWVRVELALETAGPVAVSTRQDMGPVLSGNGNLLDPDGEPAKFLLPKGNRLYIASESVNRVKVTIWPVPFLQRISMQLEEGFGGLKGILAAVFRGKR